jgi:SAM-dependent methyltransferase
MKKSEAAILMDVADYYSEKLAKYGQSPQGVDWNGKESQELRFMQLCSIIDSSKPFSVNDLGCGYGALFDYLAAHYHDITYRGMDVSADMIVAAGSRHAKQKNAHFLHADKPEMPADYGLASGIFNVRLECGDTEWQAHIEATLDILDHTSRQGFAFNCLTSYSDADKMRGYLYYADPCRLFDLCKRRYSRHVALLHDYGLYEFTILVRKDA